MKLKLMFFASLFFASGLSNAQPVKTSQATDGIPVLSQRAPEFTLKDMEGKNVSLSSLKGKVIVVDFWATWCVPCHKSFPGILMAYNKYAADKDVVFLFVDTREKSMDYERLAKEDMQKLKYPFHVLFDEIGQDGAQDRIYDLYKMAGIPTKIIIDADGIIRYKLEGYAYQHTDAENAAELGRLIDKTKRKTFN